MPEELELIVDLGVQDDGEPAVVSPEPPKADPSEPPNAGTEPPKAEGEPGKKPDGEPPHKKPGSVRARERADKAEAEKAQAQAEAAEAKRKLAELEAQIKNPKSATDPNEPQIENFEDLASWRTALAEFHRKEAAKETEERFKAEQAQREMQTRQAAWKEADAKFSTDKPDWDDVMEDLGDAIRGMDQKTHPAFPAVDAALSASELAPALKYHFGKNPEELVQMAKMDPISAIKALAKLEIKLGGAPPEPTNHKTNAPKPVVPVTAPSGSRVLEDGLLVY